MSLPEYFTFGDVRELLGVNRATCQRYYAEGLPHKQETPHSTRKTTPREFVRWHEKHVREKYRHQMQDTALFEHVGETQEAATLRLTIERANAEALKNARERNELASLSEFGQAARGALVLLRQVLMGIPGRLAKDVARESNPAVVREMLLEEVKRGLNQCADRWEDFFPPASDRLNPETAPDSPGMAVGGGETGAPPE